MAISNATPAVAAASPPANTLAAPVTQGATAPTFSPAAPASPADKQAAPGALALPVLPNPSAAVSLTPPPATTVATAPADPAAPATGPAAQLAPALIQIAHAAGGQQITVRLAPAELGRVDIRIDRAADGTATVQVLAERPETLKLLQADQPQLNQALNQAGVPQEGRNLSLSLALPDPGGSNPGASSFGSSFGSSLADGQSGGARQQRDPPPSPALTYAAPVPPPAWQRAGINITA